MRRRVIKMTGKEGGREETKRGHDRNSGDMGGGVMVVKGGCWRNKTWNKKKKKIDGLMHRIYL